MVIDSIEAPRRMLSCRAYGPSEPLFEWYRYVFQSVKRGRYTSLPSRETAMFRPMAGTAVANCVSALPSGFKICPGIPPRTPARKNFPSWFTPTDAGELVDSPAGFSTLLTPAPVLKG